MDMKMQFDVNYVREQFPALRREHNGLPVIILDGPGGSQVPKRVVEKINDYLYNHNANEHGFFATSMETDKLLSNARKTYADFFGCSPEEVAFGTNSTTNNFMLAFAIMRDLKPGDEIVITDMDHLCNRSPWMMLKERGIVVKSVAVDPEKCIIDMEDLAQKLSPKTKVAAFNYASNAIGTISDVKNMIEMAHEVGALTVVDAVHYAAHGPIDVKDIDTDFLLCSPYKFFGPHVGVLYAKKEVMEKLRTIKVDSPDISEPPLKFQTGTPTFELLCGAAEAVEFIADIGSKYEEYFTEKLEGLEGRRRHVVAGMLAIDEYEEPLAKQLRTELDKIDGVKVYGPPEGHPRTSTVSFTLERKKLRLRYVKS